MKKILAEYKCGCTWVGPRDECLEYCQTHGDDRRKIYPLSKTKAIREGWSR